ncbi:MAG TPA: GNAT family N-acetyltransferase, partial [Anaerolineales bacterium]|nr:GNAT family N-acetyltransferase [Anaerolineales bacterium]
TLETHVDSVPHIVASSEPETEQVCVRSCSASDVDPLRAMARSNHHNTRFSADRHFSAEQCSALYERWIEASCKGSADSVFVAESRIGLAGYITCHLEQQFDGKIGLLGVEETARNLGIGRKLVSEALGWFAAHGARRIQVVTQGQNIAAQRVYLRSGFLTKSVQLWYHRWFISNGRNSTDE